MHRPVPARGRSHSSSARKLAWRAGIVLATADGEGTVESMRRTGMGVVQSELDQQAKSGNLEVIRQPTWGMSVEETCAQISWIKFHHFLV